MRASTLILFALIVTISYAQDPHRIFPHIFPWRTASPTLEPTMKSPTPLPTIRPSTAPSLITNNPTEQPSQSSKSPTSTPTPSPSHEPTATPTRTPTTPPTRDAQCQEDNYLNQQKEIVCLKEKECTDCDLVTCTECEDLECRGGQSCQATELNAQCLSSGCEINCFGTESCNQAYIVGTNVKEFNCEGMQSCSQAQAHLSCITQDGCEVECLSEQSCYNAIMSVQNVKELECEGLESCARSTFSLDCTQSIDGCEVQCAGEYSCEYSFISVKKASLMDCEGSYSCASASIDINDVVDDSFELDCGMNGCQDSHVTVHVSDASVTQIRAIECELNSACKNMRLYLSADHGVSLAKLECDGAESCQNMVVVTNNVDILEFHCANFQACDGVQFLKFDSESETHVVNNDIKPIYKQLRNYNEEVTLIKEARKANIF